MSKTLVMKIHTRLTDFDLHGHVNNIAFVGFLEQARIEAFGDRLNLDFKRYSGLTAKTDIDYLRPAKFGTSIAVVFSVVDLGSKRIEMNLDVVNANKHTEVFASARVVQIMFDLQAGKPCPIPEDLRAQLEELRVDDQENSRKVA